MNNWLNLALCILACYRLSRLITLDEGPFEIFHKLRVRLGAYDYGPYGEAKTSLGKGLTCPHCVGVWIGIPLSLYASGIYWYTLLWWLAIAGGSSFLWSLNRDN